MLHAKISASKVERMVLCPASLSLEAMIPEDKSSPAAQRGTDIHAIAEAMLLNKPWGPVDDDLSIPAKEYAEFIRSMQFPFEVEVSLTGALQQVHPDLGGTADAILEDENTLIVVDLKTGRLPVSAKKNYQLMTYALGALLYKNSPRFTNVVTIIFQPGIGISQATYTEAELMAYCGDLNNAINIATDPFAKAVPGIRACLYCKAKNVCPAIRATVIENAKKEFNGNDLEQLLDDASLALEWGNSIKEEAKEKIASGVDAGKWQLRPGRKMTSWANKVGAEAYFIEYEYAYEIKSPAALRKLGLRIPEDYLEEKEAAPSLVRVDPGL